jgi:hypothetical protein
MQELTIVIEGFTQIAINFLPITVLMSAAVWVTTRLVK